MHLPESLRCKAALKNMAPPSKSADGTSKQVLIAEDEPVVRLLLQRLLKSWGYRTLSASNGKQAVEMAQQHDGEIDVLLSDITMPEMSGPELAEKLTEQRPFLKVILMSGYSQAQVALRRGWKFVQKPFKPETIKKAIETSL